MPETNMADEGSIHSSTTSKNSTVLQTLKEDGEFYSIALVDKRFFILIWGAIFITFFTLFLLIVCRYF